MSTTDAVPSPYGHRLDRLRSVMDEREVDAALIAAGANMRYYTGFSAYEGGWPIWLSTFLVPREGEAVLLLSEMHEVLLGESRSWVHEVRTYPDGAFPGPLLEQALRSAGILDGRLGVEDDLWFGDVDLLRIVAPDAGLRSIGADLERIRGVKDAHELEILEQAAALNDLGYQAAFEAARVGVPMYEVGQAAIAAMVAQGAETSAIAGDFRTLRPDPLKPGDILDVDLAWTRYRGYHTDSARNVFVKSVEPEHRRIYEAVEEAYAEALKVIRPQVPAEDVHRRAEAVLAEHGLRQPWKIGHGIGLSQRHEWPLLQEGNRTPLEPGMVFTVDPGAFVEQDGRVVPIHIESIVAVTEDGYRELTTFETGLLLADGPSA